MNQPSKPRRAETIARKLAYAEKQRSELSQKLHSIAGSNAQPLFVGEEVGSILSACRECLDYAARDVCAAYVPTGSKQLKEYFPLRMQSLDAGLVGKTKTTHPTVYDYFARLIGNIDADALIANTMFHYGLVREVNDLVNDKKHDETNEVRVRANSATRINFGGTSVVMSPVFSVGPGMKVDFGNEQLDAPEVIAPDDVGVEFISEHRLKANNWEVVRYCMHAIGATRFILSDLYKTLFQIPPETFDPAQYLKSPEEKAYEAAIVACAPIVHRLSVLAFRLRGNTELLLRYSFEGRAEVSNVSAATLADDAWTVFERVVLPQVAEAHLTSVMKERLVESAKSPGTPRYVELTIDLKEPKVLHLDRDVTYDSVLFGISTRFNHHADASHRKTARVMAPGEAEALAEQMFGIAPVQWRTVVGAQPLGFGQTSPT